MGVLLALPPNLELLENIYLKNIYLKNVISNMKSRMQRVMLVEIIISF